MFFTPFIILKNKNEKRVFKRKAKKNGENKSFKIKFKKIFKIVLTFIKKHSKIHDVDRKGKKRL